MDTITLSNYKNNDYALKMQRSPVRHKKIFRREIKEETASRKLCHYDLQTVHTYFGVASRAMSMINRFVNDIFER